MRSPTGEAFHSFFDALGEQRSQALTAVTCDAAGAYRSVAQVRAGNATICLDPFHVIKWANEAVDAFYNSNPPPPIDEVTGCKAGQRYRPNWHRLRAALRTGRERLTETQQALITAARRHSRRLWRATKSQSEHGAGGLAARCLFRRVGFALLSAFAFRFSLRFLLANSLSSACRI
jgi:transposase